MKRLRSGIFFTLLLLLFFEIWIGFPIPIEMAPPNRKALVDEAGEDNAQQKAKGVHLVETREGHRDWELFSELAESSQGMAAWQLQKVKVQFYRDKIIEFVVTGQTGYFDSKTRDIKIEGNVRTITANGYVIDTDSIHFQADRRILESPGLVRMKSPARKGLGPVSFKGEGLVAFVDSKELEIRKNVEALHPMKDQNPMRVNAQKAFFKTIDSSVRFEGAVKVSNGTKQIEGPKALFLYADAAERLQSVKMDGGVQMKDSNRYATSDSVRFDPEVNSYILSGSPRVVQDLDEILGEEITLLEGGRKIKVDRIKARVEQD